MVPPEALESILALAISKVIDGHPTASWRCRSPEPIAKGDASHCARALLEALARHDLKIVRAS